jgi:TPR repeat protein
MFFDRYQLYSLIYEKLYGQPKHHSYLTDSADQYWHGMWILACHFNDFDDLIMARNILEKSAKASNMFALNYVGYSLYCGAVPFDIDEERGIELMMKAADMGHPIGMLNVGKFLWQHGKYEKAISLLQKGLCDVEDDGGAYSLLAKSYAQGLGTLENPDKGEKYAQLSKVTKMCFKINDMLASNHLWRHMAYNSEIRF